MAGKDQVDDQTYRDEVLDLLQQILAQSKLINDSLNDQATLLASLVNGLTPFKET